MLFHLRPGAALALRTDSSETAIGDVLEQRGPLGWEPLAFYSSKLKTNEQLWPPNDRELLGAFKGIRHFRDLIEGRAFTLYTNHQSLIPSLLKKMDPQTAPQTYQLSCISEYTTDIRYVQGKAIRIADVLSRPNKVVADINWLVSSPLQHQQQQQQAATHPISLDESTTACPEFESQSHLLVPALSNLSSILPSASAAVPVKPVHKFEN